MTRWLLIAFCLCMGVLAVVILGSAGIVAALGTVVVALVLNWIYSGEGQGSGGTLAERLQGPIEPGDRSYSSAIDTSGGGGGDGGGGGGDGGSC